MNGTITGSASTRGPATRARTSPTCGRPPGPSSRRPRSPTRRQRLATGELATPSRSRPARSTSRRTSRQWATTPATVRTSRRRVSTTGRCTRLQNGAAAATASTTTAVRAPPEQHLQERQLLGRRRLRDRLAVAGRSVPAGRAARRVATNSDKYERDGHGQETDGSDVMSSVSVVIPCYRYGHFLEQAVRSVLDDQPGVDVAC